MTTGHRFARCNAIAVLVCLSVVATTATVSAQLRPLRDGPDLMIREITLTEVGAGPVGANLGVQVGVMNIGKGQAGGFNLALIYMSNLDMDNPYIKIEMKQVSPIAAGDGLAVHFTIPAHPGTPNQGTLIAIADPPISQHASGALTEGRLMLLMPSTGARGRTDVNNVFGVVFDATNHPMPLKWLNPAAE